MNHPVEGFRKVHPDRWEFANEGFLRAQKHLLKTIHRRKSSQQQSLGPYLDREIDRLKRDKNNLMEEVVKLRKQQQNTRAQIQAMEDRLEGTEQKQQQMMAFLARAIQNPNFLEQLVEQNDRRKELEEAITKKRRRPIDRGSDFETTFGPQVQELENTCGYDFSELENLLALEFEGLGGKSKEEEEHGDEQESGVGELNDDFWEELLSEGIGEEKGSSRSELEGRDEDVNILSERLGYLSSSSLE